MVIADHDSHDELGRGYSSAFEKQQHQIDSLRILLSRQAHIEQHLNKTKDALIQRMDSALKLLNVIKPNIVKHLSDQQLSDWNRIENLLDDTQSRPMVATKNRRSTTELKRQSLSSLSESEMSDCNDLRSSSSLRSDHERQQSEKRRESLKACDGDQDSSVTDLNSRINDVVKEEQNIRRSDSMLHRNEKLAGIRVRDSQDSSITDLNSRINDVVKEEQNIRRSDSMLHRNEKLAEIRDRDRGISVQDKITVHSLQRARSASTIIPAIDHYDNFAASTVRSESESSPDRSGSERDFGRERNRSQRRSLHKNSSKLSINISEVSPRTSTKSSFGDDMQTITKNHDMIVTKPIKSTSLKAVHSNEQNVHGGWHSSLSAAQQESRTRQRSKSIFDRHVQEIIDGRTQPKDRHRARHLSIAN